MISPRPESRGFRADKTGSYQVLGERVEQPPRPGYRYNRVNHDKFVIQRRIRQYLATPADKRRETYPEMWRKITPRTAKEQLKVKLDIKQGKYTCGFCKTNDHLVCPVGVVDGNGQMVLCACDCHDMTSRRCLRCGEIGDVNLIDASWKCRDTNVCDDTLKKLRGADSVFARIEKAYEATLEQKRKEAAKKREHRDKVNSSRGNNPPCTCGCGGTTKGGMFLPGHDSKYLSSLMALDKVEAVRRAEMVSDAFAMKLIKRLG